MTLNRVRVAITGASGLPGVSTFYFDSTTVDMGALRTFWIACAAQFPNTVSVAIPNSGDQFQEADGLITGTWVGPAQAAVSGSGGVGSYLSTAGVMIRWTPNGIIDGRRPIGKTFIVPAMTSTFSSGTVASSVVTALSTAAVTLLGAYGGAMKLWHRKNAKGVGAQLTLIGGAASNKQVVLRSRRD